MGSGVSKMVHNCMAFHSWTTLTTYLLTSFPTSYFLKHNDENMFKRIYIRTIEIQIIFLEPLGASDNSDNANLLFSEFIDGFKRAKNQKELVSQFD